MLPFYTFIFINYPEKSPVTQEINFTFRKKYLKPRNCDLAKQLDH